MRLTSMYVDVNFYSSWFRTMRSGKIFISRILRFPDALFWMNHTKTIHSLWVRRTVIIVEIEPTVTWFTKTEAFHTEALSRESRRVISSWSHTCTPGKRYKNRRGSIQDLGILSVWEINHISSNFPCFSSPLLDSPFGHFVASTRVTSLFDTEKIWKSFEDSSLNLNNAQISIMLLSQHAQLLILLISLFC